MKLNETLVMLMYTMNLMASGRKQKREIQIMPVEYRDLMPVIMTTTTSPSHSSEESGIEYDEGWSVEGCLSFIFWKIIKN